MDERGTDSAAIAHWWRRIQDATSGMRRAWATSRASKPALLELLCSVDDDEIVRLAVASPNLDSGALDRLAGHSSAIVRMGVVNHARTGIDTIALLATDVQRDVATIAVERMSVAEEVRHRITAARHEYTSRYTLVSLQRDSDPQVSAAAYRELTIRDERGLAALQANLEAPTASPDQPLKIDQAVEASFESQAQPTELQFAAPEVLGPIITEAQQPFRASVGPLPSSDVSDGRQKDEEHDISVLLGDGEPAEGAESTPESDADESALWFETDPWEQASEYRHGQDLFELLDAGDEDDESSEFNIPDAGDAIRSRAEIMADDIMFDAGWQQGRDVLIDALARRNLGQLRTAIIREINRGMQPEELSLAIELREYWKENWAANGFSMLTWPQTLTLIRGFNGYPDIVEVTEFLSLVFSNFRNGKSNFRTFDYYMWNLLDHNEVRNRGNFDATRYRLQA